MPKLGIRVISVGGLLLVKAKIGITAQTKIQSDLSQAALLMKDFSFGSYGNFGNFGNASVTTSPVSAHGSG
jgi:hypothetical protein